MEKHSLAEKVLGVSSLDQDNALHEAYRSLTRSELGTSQIEDECRRLDTYDLNNWDNIPPQDQERITMLHIIRQIFKEGQMRYSNVLQHWPMYEARYNRLQPAASQDSGSRRALQIGCLSALSSAAFAALAHDVYRARPLTIDLTVSDMRALHGDYVITDALKPGIASNSIHVAQTNCLLHMLESPNNPGIDPRNQTNQLFNEMYRVVRPGGHVILYEIASGLDTDEHPVYDSRKSKARFEQFKVEVATGLAQAGFRSILMEPATEITGVEYLFDPNRDFTQYETYERAATVVVSASKPS